jgi:hypothetical protein
MKKIFLILFLSLCLSQANAQSMFFPKNWLGRWKGTLNAYTTGGNLQSVETQLILEAGKKTNEYYLTIVYINTGGMEDTRSYTLIADSTQPGHYIIDEGNGISTNNYLFGTHLLSQYLVQGHLLTISYSFEREAIRMRIVTATAVPKGSSGGKDGLPKVQDFEIISYQDALLSRVKQ